MAWFPEKDPGFGWPQTETYLKDTGMVGLASARAMARRRPLFHCSCFIELYSNFDSMKFVNWILNHWLLLHLNGNGSTIIHRSQWPDIVSSSHPSIITHLFLLLISRDCDNTSCHYPITRWAVIIHDFNACRFSITTINSALVELCRAFQSDLRKNPTRAKKTFQYRSNGPDHSLRSGFIPIIHKPYDGLRLIKPIG